MREIRPSHQWQLSFLSTAVKRSVLDTINHYEEHWLKINITYYQPFFPSYSCYLGPLLNFRYSFSLKKNDNQVTATPIGPPQSDASLQCPHILTKDAFARQNYPSKISRPVFLFFSKSKLLFLYAMIFKARKPSTVWRGWGRLKTSQQIHCRRFGAACPDLRATLNNQFGPQPTDLQPIIMHHHHHPNSHSQTVRWPVSDQTINQSISLYTISSKNWPPPKTELRFSSGCWRPPKD